MEDAIKESLFVHWEQCDHNAGVQEYPLFILKYEIRVFQC